MFRNENFLFKAAALAGFSSLAAIGVWSALPAATSWSADHRSIVEPNPGTDAYVTQAAFSLASMSTSAATPKRSAVKGECANSWDVSPEVMEEILQQMIRHGWRPPTQGMAVGLPQIQPDDPNATVPLRWNQAPVTEDGPIPPTPADQVQVSGPVTPQPAAPSVIFVPQTPAPMPAAGAPAGAAALIAEPRAQ